MRETSLKGYIYVLVVVYTMKHGLSQENDTSTSSSNAFTVTATARCDYRPKIVAYTGTGIRASKYIQIGSVISFKIVPTLHCSSGKFNKASKWKIDGEIATSGGTILVLPNTLWILHVTADMDRVNISYHERNSTASYTLLVEHPSDFKDAYIVVIVLLQAITLILVAVFGICWLKNHSSSNVQGSWRTLGKKNERTSFSKDTTDFYSHLPDDSNKTPENSGPCANHRAKILNVKIEDQCSNNSNVSEYEVLDEQCRRHTVVKKCYEKLRISENGNIIVDSSQGSTTIEGRTQVA